MIERTKSLVRSVAIDWYVEVMSRLLSVAFIQVFVLILMASLGVSYHPVPVMAESISVNPNTYMFSLVPAEFSNISNLALTSTVFGINTTMFFGGS